MSDILLKENILTNCKVAPKEEIVKKLGDMLNKSGYTTPAYTEAMLEKEKVFNTHIGFGLAIPHGVEGSNAEVIKSGIAIMTFPQGIQWGDQGTVKLVVGIAGKGDEHMDILSNIAMNCSSEEAVATIAESDADSIYSLFTA